MGQPRFSIVIPTRERPDTLRFTLRTCLDQTFDDYEIVVCDNCSGPETRRIVEDAGSPRIRYVRSPDPLPMVDNWNLAYSHARGEYISFLGDDDALMPYALTQLHELIKAHPLAAVRWDWAIYTWPNVALTEMANYLSVPLDRCVRILDSRQSIRDVLAGRVVPETLPNVYHSLVAREVLERMRRQTGRVFDGWYPDTFTSFSVASLIERHLSVTVPMSMIGLSGASNGVAAIFLRGKHPVAHEYRSITASAGQRLHPWVPDLPILWSVLCDSFLRAKAAFFPDDATLTLDRKQLAERCVEAMPADDAAEQEAVMQAVGKSLSDDERLVKWFDQRFREAPPLQPRGSIRPGRLGYDGHRLHLDMVPRGVTDIVGAVALTRDLLGGDSIGYDLVPRTELYQSIETATIAANEKAQELEHQLNLAQRDGALRHVPKRVTQKVLRLLRGA